MHKNTVTGQVSVTVHYFFLNAEIYDLRDLPVARLLVPDRLTSQKLLISWDFLTQAHTVYIE